MKKANRAVAQAVQQTVDAVQGAVNAALDQLPVQLAATIKGVANHSGFPTFLVFVVIVFLVIQDRVDRRDHKLAAAPLRAEADIGFTDEPLTLVHGLDRLQEVP
jgi:hypothetical protein